MSLQKAIVKRNMVAQAVSVSQTKQKKIGLEREMNLQMANAKRETAARDDILI